jgi:hypothetical protein
VDQRSADRASVPDGWVPHERGGLGQEGRGLADLRRSLQAVGPGPGADHELGGLGADEVELVQPVHVDEDAGLREAEVHHRDEALPARDDLGLISKGVQQLNGLVDAPGCSVLEGRWLHGRGSFDGLVDSCVS